MMLKEFNLTPYQEDQFQKYYEFLISENTKYNLTSITSRDEVYIKHFYDSMKVKDYLDFSNVKTICDIGSGAGFPGIPLKILYPHLELTIIEPTLKRCNFLKNLVDLLKLDNVIIINDRSEIAIKDYREHFDIVTARAVANLPILLELTIPYVRVKGYFLALKGANYEEEIVVAKNALSKLNSTIENIYTYELPSNLGNRSLIKVKKNDKTSTIYPRSYAAIKKKHL